MKSVQTIVIVLHVLAGSVALLSMWLPMFSKKGGKLHRRAGWVYVWSMAVVSVSAIVASGVRLALEPNRREGALFLMMVAILGGVATWWGVSVLQQKSRSRASCPVDWVASAALLLSGLAGIVYWALGAMLLFAIFGALNVAIGARFLHTLRTAPSSRWWWWFEHFFGMIVACIGTVTAFLVVNYASAPEALRNAIPSVAVWVAPGIVGGAALGMLKRYYQARLKA